MGNVKRRGNGQGTAFKRGGTWTAQVSYWVTDNKGNKQRKYKTKGGFKLKKDALNYIHGLQNGTTPEVEADTITFAELYDKWSAEHYQKIGKDTVNGYKAAYAKCLGIWHRKFLTLKSNDLQRVVDNARAIDGGVISRRSKADIKSLFNNMYKYALKNDIADKDYAEFVELPKKEKSKKEAFSPADIVKLWEDYERGSSFTGYILIMIYTGMRYGEISTIQKRNVHLAEQYIIGGIKTDAGIDRVIPISDKILPIVTEIYNSSKKKLLEMPEKMFYNKFYATLSKLGIRELPPHTCRHTFFTMLAAEGVQPAIITQVGGHTDYQTTMGYTHTALSDKLAAVNKL